MHDAVRFTQGDDGRWKWLVFVPHGTSGEGDVGISAISFQHQWLAEADFERHTCAPSDGTGRRVRSRQDILGMLQQCMQSYNECAAVKLGELRWHHGDTTGSNWEISLTHCPDDAHCLSKLRVALNVMHDMYNIPYEG